MPNIEPNEVEDDAEDEAPTCPRCEQAEDSCECIHCDNCNEYVDHGCECSSCNHCGDSFNEDNRHACVGCGYCGRCIANGRVEHYQCSSCSECQNEDRRSCENCGEYECCVSFTCRQDDCNRCSGCCNCEQASDESDYVKNYSCRDYPDAKPSPRTVAPNFLYLGVECETELDEDEDIHPVAKVIHDKHSHEILMKEDGSLDHGIELVTGRYSLEAHQAMWPELCKTAIGAGLRSWKHSSTGLHVHMSRAFFKPLDIGKVLVFINSDNAEVRKNIRRLAGRGANHYCKIAKKKFTDFRLSEDRYEAVNLTNDATIEVRIFKGTLNADHVLADIEFCHAVAHWVKETSTQDIESWGSFWAYAMKHKKQYQHFLRFLAPSQSELFSSEELHAEDRETVAA